MISVIVPIYNVFDYLYDCVRSIVAQTETDWELILVDDGSTDASGSLADSLAAQDDRIRVIHQANAGLAAARNAGLDIARGSYITFVDSDDAIAPRYLETLASLAARIPGAIASVGHREFAGQLPGPDSLPPANWPVRRYSPDAAIESALYQQGLDHSAWGKLYPTHVFADQRFTTGILYEDIDIFYRIFPLATAVAHSDAPLYLYRRGRAGSILATFSPKRADILDAIVRMEDQFRRTNPRLLRAARDRRLNAAFDILHQLHLNRALRTYPELADRCRRYIRDIRRESLADPRVRLKTKIGIILNYLRLDTPLYRLLPK